MAFGLGALGRAALLAVVLTNGLAACRASDSVASQLYPSYDPLHIDGHGLQREPHALERFVSANASVQVDARIRISPELSSSGEWASVLVEGVADPRMDDVLALSVPAGAHPALVTPVKYKWLAPEAGYMTSGSATVRFRILNLRQSMDFLLIRNGLERPTVAARSQEIGLKHPGAPLRVHLSLTGLPGQVAVHWSGAKDSRAVRRSEAAGGALEPGTYPAGWVEYGPADAARYASTASARAATYDRTDMCGPPASTVGWLDPGVLYSATLEGLEAGREYRYRVGIRASETLYSEEFAFLAPPRGAGPSAEADAAANFTSGASGDSPGADLATVKMLAFADVGAMDEDGSYELDQVFGARAALLAAARELREGGQPGLTLAMLLGDVSYACGYGAMWALFWDRWERVFARLPLMTAVGNHERDWPGSGDRFPMQHDSGGECGVPYYRHTGMPTLAEDQPWYSFDHGPIHFVIYSTEHAFEQGSKQYDFIASDIKSIDRTKTPWLIVGGHRPMYVDSTYTARVPDGDQYVGGLLRATFEELFYEYQVDATWHGHHHSYQRTCPILNGQCMDMMENDVAPAAIHLIIGHGGAALTPNVLFKQPKEFERVQLKHGYVIVEANATHLVHDVKDFDGNIMDRLVLHKPPGWVFEARPRPGGGRWRGGTATAA